MGWVEILPKFESMFRAAQWEAAESFLSWTGILVNLHPKRTVEQVVHSSPAMSATIGGGPSLYLKKESGVTFLDLFRNAWHGFGWCATAVREGAILQAAQRAGVGCPEVVALGEAGKEAFVVTRAETDMTELRTVLMTLWKAEARHRLAEALGRELARMHDAGFDHADLFAKHILVGTAAPVRGDGRKAYRFCILDWQRARWRASVSWRLRIRDLALLDATLHGALASDRLRVRCMRAYLQATKQKDALPLARLVREIRHASGRLLTQRRLRELRQLPINEQDQRFVQQCEGRLLVVQSYHEERSGRHPAAFARLLDLDAPIRAVVWELSALGLAVHTSAENDMPALAQTLFRLQLFGVSAPRLVAVCRSDTHAHVITRAPTSVSFDEACAKACPSRRGQWLQQAGAIVRSVHEAGYSLPMGDCWTHRLGVDAATGDVILRRVVPMERRSTPWQEFAPAELSNQKVYLSRTDRLRFLSGYLGEPRGRRHALRTILPLTKSKRPTLERQAAG